MGTDRSLETKPESDYRKPCGCVLPGHGPGGEGLWRAPGPLTWHGASTGAASSFLASAGAECAAVKHACVRAVPFPHGHGERRALWCLDQKQRTAAYESPGTSRASQVCKSEGHGQQEGAGGWGLITALLGARLDGPDKCSVRKLSLAP